MYTAVYVFKHARGQAEKGLPAQDRPAGQSDLDGLLGDIG
jgi:hypothetical protein